MHAKDLFLDDSSYWHAIKAVYNSLPYLNVVSCFTLIMIAITLFVEAVDASDRGRFVITP